MKVREFRPTDLIELVNMVTESVHGLASAEYDEEQRKTWAPVPWDLDHWQQKITGQRILLAEHEGELIGCIGYEPDGHLDILFTATGHARKGVATTLYRQVETELRTIGVAQILTEASAVARPFFARQGFLVREQQSVERGSVSLHRFLMSKCLRS
jgi:putative acetyltransferase